MYCSKCGTKAADDSKFCSNCGQAFAAPNASTSDGENVKVGGFAWYLYIVGFLAGLVITAISIVPAINLNLWGILGVVFGVGLAYLARRSAVTRRDA